MSRRGPPPEADPLTGIIRPVRYRAVFFDVGGTLVDSRPSFPELFAATLTRAGHPVSPEAVREASIAVTDGFSRAAQENRLWTTSAERSRAFWTSVYDLMLQALDLPMGDGLRDILYETFTDPSNYRLYDDVRPALDRLGSDGYVLGLISNFEAWLDELLADLGVRERFSVRVISGIEGIEKPDPRIYELALSRAALPASDVAYVGDLPEFDVDPPAELGMHPILLDRRERFADHAGARITDLGELLGALDG
jgi:putative hydrolase of the HAD superfamily